MRASVAALVLILTACAHEQFVSDRLFCGLSIPAGGTVSQSDIDTFITEIIEPRFPQGFTVWRARGQWRGGNEDALVFEFVHRRDPLLDAKVQEIATAYRTRFAQQAVLRAVTRVRMQLITR
ncbi:MAG: DUF3574 domain-containing protein [Acidobacteriota bacterium]|nr:DUF3574 domain-containing protein [Acidobacteriota bacterium]